MEEAVVVPQTSQEFCLRWNNYHSSLISTLDSFKNEQMFVDVTLGCEGKYLVAHKMLLSACSAFFRDLIKLYPCPHPIIILPPEVRHSDMEKLLHFIYQGEVNVLQENLARFLKTAEMLKIKGLADDSEKQKVLRSCTDGQDSPCVGSGNINTASGSSSCGDNTGTSPKRPRLSLEASSSIATNSPASAPAAPTVSCGSSSCSNSNNTSTAAASLLLDTPNTPNNTEDSAHSANESDSEMLPVKQEMVELKNCTEFETDGEPFNPDKYLAAAAETSCSSKQPPPPPGTLLPSYVPPPPIKAQEDSPGSGNASDELSQGGMSLRLMSGGMMMAVPPLHLLRHPMNLSQSVICDTPPSRYSTKRKSPSMAVRRSSPPQYMPHHRAPQHPTPPPPSHSSTYTPNTNHTSLPSYTHSLPSTRRSLPNHKTPRYRKSPVLSSSKVTPTNRKSPLESPKSWGPSPNSPPGKLRQCYSSPELMTTSSPDENKLPQNSASHAHLAGASPLTCDICQKTFTSRSNLNKHMRVQHSGEEYSCNLCQRTFKNRYYIKEHTSLCANASLKKEAAAAAAASAVAGVISSSQCPASSSMINSNSSMSAMTPPAHPTAMMPAPGLHAASGTPLDFYKFETPENELLTPDSRLQVPGLPAASKAPLDFHKFEPQEYDDEQPTDLAIHGRTKRTTSPKQAH